MREERKKTVLKPFFPLSSTPWGRKTKKICGGGKMNKIKSTENIFSTSLSKTLEGGGNKIL